MRILTRYLLRLHIGPFFFALSSLTLLLLLDQVSKKFEKLVGKGLHWTVIAEVFLYSIPFILAQTLPMAVFIAVLYTFNRLALDNEITAIRAGGIPLHRILVPLVVAGSLLAGGLVWFNNTILPESNHRLQVLYTSIGQKMPTFELREQTINEVLPGQLYLQAARVDRPRSGLEDVAIYDERLAGRSRTIYADSGRMAYNEAQTDLYLTLHDGVLQEQMVTRPHSYSQMHFGRLIMRVEGVTNEFQRDELGGWRSDREMPIAQMKEEVAKALEQVEQTRLESREYAVALAQAYARGIPPLKVPEVDSLVSSRVARIANQEDTAWEAVSRYNSYRMQLSAARSQANRYRVEIQKKYSIPAACIVFVLLGAPIALRYPLGGVALVVAVSFVVFCAYYVALVGGEQMADRLYISPFWAMWGPNVLFGTAGLVLVWRARRAGR